MTKYGTLQILRVNKEKEARVVILPGTLRNCALLFEHVVVQLERTSQIRIDPVGQVGQTVDVRHETGFLSNAPVRGVKNGKVSRNPPRTISGKVLRCQGTCNERPPCESCSVRGSSSYITT